MIKEIVSGVKRSFVALRATFVAAQISIADISDAFYDEYATEDTGRYWWWIRMILLEPNELIVDNGKDDLFRVPFTIGTGTDADGDQNIIFGEPTKVVIEYVDVAARSEQVYAACNGIASVRGEFVAARFDSRVESRLNSNEGGGMREYVERMRAKLGLSADVSDEQVLAKAAEHLEAEQGQSGNDGGAGASADGDPDPNPAPEPDPEPDAGASSATDETVSVDRGTLEELRAGAAAGIEARNAQIREADEALLNAAVSTGKIAPSRREHFAKLLKADRDGTKEIIDALEENVVPVSMRGTNSGESGSNGLGGRADDVQQYLAAHMPDVVQRKQRILAGATTSRVTTDQ